MSTKEGTQKKAKLALQECVRGKLRVKIDIEDIELISYEELGKMLFKLQNK
jgi:hypothetical protein